MGGWNEVNWLYEGQMLLSFGKLLDRRRSRGLDSPLLLTEMATNHTNAQSTHTTRREKKQKQNKDHLFEVRPTP